MVEVRPLGLDGVLEIRTTRHEDARGWFTETWSAARFAADVSDHDWVQDNQVYSRKRGTVRALHFQRAPMAQAKLVRVLCGAVFDVAVDIRPSSPHFGRWTGLELTADAGNQILVPRGFAHGYITLTDDAEVAYKVDAPYSPAHEQGIAWNDPAIGVNWPDVGDPIINDRDRAAPLLAEADLGQES